ncbi:hypothetical protein [Microcoleus sp. S13C4]|uniref:hypothetical protein n=1 Tax=Microcoleus sp. S13C4 TaxID=3055410 RepID=UPI002FD151A8
MTAEINIRLKKSGGLPQIYLYCAPVATAGISSLKVSRVKGISIISQLAVGSWQLAVGSWQLAVGSWQLAVVTNYQLPITNYQLPITYNIFSKP